MNVRQKSQFQTCAHLLTILVSEREGFEFCLHTSCVIIIFLNILKSEGTFFMPIVGEDIKKVNFNADKRHLLPRGH